MTYFLWECNRRIETALRAKSKRNAQKVSLFAEKVLLFPSMTAFLWVDFFEVL